MKRGGFLSFLIFSLALTAFLAGYIIVKRGVREQRASTGTILDKFGREQQSSNNQEPDKTQVVLAADRKIVSLANSLDKKGVVYFEKNTGKLFKFNFETNQEVIISDTILPNFLSALWSPIKNELISSFYSPEGVKFKYHNYGDNKTASLDSQIGSIAISPDGDLAAYYQVKAGDNTLQEPSSDNGGDEKPTEIMPNKIFISQLDGTYPKKILDTRITSLDLYWPLKNKIAFVTPSFEIFLLSKEGQLTKLLEYAPNLSFKWSSRGEKILYSTSQDINNPGLLRVRDTETKSELGLDTPTIASKCAWSIDEVNIFCAVSKSPSVDDIYKINATDGSKKLIAETNMLVKELYLPALEEYLMLIGAGDEKLYSIKINHENTE